mgnify:CR=1 FL=1
MTMTLTQQAVTIAMVVAGTMLTRFLPFLLFPAGKPTPKFVKYLATLCGKVRKREDCAQRIDHLLFGSHLSVTTKPNSDGVVELHQFSVLFEKIRRVLSLLHFHDPVLVLQGLSHLILLPGHFDHIAQRVQMDRGLLQNGLEALLCFANLFMIR